MCLTYNMKKKTTEKVWHKIIQISMFSDVLVVFQEGEDAKEFKDIINTYKLAEEDKDKLLKGYSANGDANGFVLNISIGRICLVVFKKAPKGTLSHEALHAAEMLCEHRNIPITTDTEELRAMLVGEIVNQASGLLF